MNILERNKEMIIARKAGESSIVLCKRYGVDHGSFSKAFYEYEYLIDKPYYDVVAGMNFSDQVGIKLVNLLHKYECMNNVDLTLETVKDIPRHQFHVLRGAGVSTMKAFDRLQEALRNE